MRVKTIKWIRPILRLAQRSRLHSLRVAGDKLHPTVPSSIAANGMAALISTEAVSAVDLVPGRSMWKTFRVASGHGHPGGSVL
ncbi:hypothetical protein H920_02668 [Fukomys damarensis]|uniref:Uncharacterized protein n=1 Tax=Fukomys damarensis TaxID=885580 RepID=A0A091DUX9_FUKDA|nr:hypothetical protein H920_02668 [Fukomys damarensis]